jgi:hypothetical protein
MRKQGRIFTTEDTENTEEEDRGANNTPPPAGLYHRITAFILLH